MCCQGLLKKVVPFAITFTLGLFVAGIFYGFSNLRTERVDRFDNSSTHRKCDHQMIRMNHEFERDVILLDVPPPPAPAVAPEAPLAPSAPVAPDEVDVTVFPPTPPETIILKEELKAKSKK